MLGKAFGISNYKIWKPLTLLIRSFLLDNFCSCSDCGSENIVRDGYGERETMPDIPMPECRDCGRNFCLRADMIFYWKHASMGELFIVTWIFFGKGSRDWSRLWFCDIGKYCGLEWFERLEKKLVGHAGGISWFLDGFFQADEMHIRSFGEKLVIFGVKKSDGRSSRRFSGVIAPWSLLRR